jgi:hypothetical protein
MMSLSIGSEFTDFGDGNIRKVLEASFDVDSEDFPITLKLYELNSNITVIDRAFTIEEARELLLSLKDIFELGKIDGQD